MKKSNAVVETVKKNTLIKQRMFFSVIADSKTTFLCLGWFGLLGFFNASLAFCHGVIPWFTKMQALCLLISYLVCQVCNLVTLLIKNVSGKHLYVFLLIQILIFSPTKIHRVCIYFGFQESVLHKLL